MMDSSPPLAECDSGAPAQGAGNRSFERDGTNIHPRRHFASLLCLWNVSTTREVPITNMPSQNIDAKPTTHTTAVHTAVHTRSSARPLALRTLHGRRTPRARRQRCRRHDAMSAVSLCLPTVGSAQAGWAPNINLTTWPPEAQPSVLLSSRITQNRRPVLATAFFSECGGRWHPTSSQAYFQPTARRAGTSMKWSSDHCALAPAITS
jgi:hypothetical protein